MRPARAVLSPDALRHNFSMVREAAPAASVMAIIKANGYGHGLVWAARTLREADAFGVASVEDAVALRDAGVNQPIVLLEGFFHANELPALLRYKLDSVVHHQRQIVALEQLRSHGTINLWVKVDTGMHRLGIAPLSVPDTVRRLKACASTGAIRLLSHFPNADNPLDTATPAQIRQLESFDTGLEKSLANSAGIMHWPASHLDWVRPGIMLYGASPLAGTTAEKLNLRPVMTLCSELIAVNERRKGDTIGYGGDWTCPEDMPVGVVAIGYGDGYPRHVPSGTPVLVNGKRVPLIGRVSMDMVTVDLRSQPEAQPGDPVVLWGEGLPVEEIATRAGTISYDLLCRVTARVPRIASTSSV